MPAPTSHDVARRRLEVAIAVPDENPDGAIGGSCEIDVAVPVEVASDGALRIAPDPVVDARLKRAISASKKNGDVPFRTVADGEVR
jgi:hypothetical protein